MVLDGGIDGAAPPRWMTLGLIIAIGSLVLLDGIALAVIGAERGATAPVGAAATTSSAPPPDDSTTGARGEHPGA